MAYDAATSTVVLFGGSAGLTYFHRTWTWSDPGASSAFGQDADGQAVALLGETVLFLSRIPQDVIAAIVSRQPEVELSAEKVSVIISRLRLLHKAQALRDEVEAAGPAADSPG